MDYLIIKSLILLLLFFSFAITAIGQENTENWIKTEATIVEVYNKRKAKNTRAFAKVSFTAKEGKQYESQVELLAIPLIGTTKSVRESLRSVLNVRQGLKKIYHYLANTKPSPFSINAYGLGSTINKEHKIFTSFIKGYCRTGKCLCLRSGQLQYIQYYK